jgi:cytochrome c oxidase subunit 3
MSSVTTIPNASVPPPVRPEPGLAVLEDRRGTFGMWLTIATEGMLFICLFFAYFYLAKPDWQWGAETPPHMSLAIINAAVLVASGGVIAFGGRLVRLGRYLAARLLLAVTIVLGLGSLTLEALDNLQHVATLTPQMSAYGSIFYTITIIHSAHEVVGIWLLIYILILPRLQPVDRSPHQPFHNVALYWYFVVVVWLWILAFLYVAPNAR